MARLAAARVVVYSLLSLAVVGTVYSELLPLFDMATSGGEFEGFLSPTIANLETMVPLVLAAMALGIVLWYLVSGAQEEKTRQQVRRRR